MYSADVHAEIMTRHHSEARGSESQMVRYEHRGHTTVFFYKDGSEVHYTWIEARYQVQRFTAAQV